MNAEERMSRAILIFIGCCVAAAVAALAILICIVWLMVGPAKAQHVHQHETITDPKVAKFYETWKRPPSRLISCCNFNDCFAAQIRRGSGGLQYLHKWSGTWAALPPSLIESNQPDPRESPNTENHVCASIHDPGIVYCAALGSGT